MITHVMYLCHPVGAPTIGEHCVNLERAKRWVRWVFDRFPNVAVVANWLYECEVLDDFNPEHRKLGFQHNFAILKRCDGVLLVGGRISTGMAAERQNAWNHNIPVYNLTVLGEEPPETSRITLKDWVLPPPPDEGSEHPAF